MLLSLGDVTKLFHVNFFDVQKKIYIDNFFAGGSGTKHECCRQERDQIRYIYMGVGGRGTESCGSRTEKSVPRMSLAQ